MALALVFFSGTLFALGLGVSGMTQLEKVSSFLNFLDTETRVLSSECWVVVLRTLWCTPRYSDAPPCLSFLRVSCV